MPPMSENASSATAADEQPGFAERIIELLEQENKRRLVPHTINMAYKYTMMDENVAVPGTETDHGTATYRNVHFRLDEQQKKLWEKFYYCPNFVKNFMDMCLERREKIAIAYRPIACIVREKAPGSSTPMEITYFQPTKYLTFSDMWYHAENFGKGLVAMGEKKGTTVCIHLETRWEWMACAFGVWSQQLVLGTVYANLGVEQLEKAFKETECGTIITTRSKIPEFIDMMKRRAIQRVRLIVLDSPPAVVAEGVVTSPTSPFGNPIPSFEGYEIIDWMDVVKLGAKSDFAVDLPTDNDALALIMYTSGTTGDPKGVMHTYGGITSGIHNFEEVIENYVNPKLPDDTYICQMPLAHIFEFSFTSIFLARGDLVCFGSPRTLIDTFARPHGDYKEFKPCFLIGVARIFDTIKKAAEAKIPARGTLERAIYEHAFKSHLEYAKEGFDTPFWNETVFAPLREVTGGKVRCAFGAGGPISVPTQNFLNSCMFTMEQGWGMTETNSNGTKQRNGDLDTFCIGAMEAANEMKLEDTEFYKHTDKPEPRGEVCIRGPFLFKGYYKKPELTKEAIDTDGWFHTGDVGAITSRGRFRIVGRVKALAKNTLGEYIPMEALETMYADNPLSVPNGVCVLVHPERNYIAAIVCTDESKVAAFLYDIGKGYRAETMKWPHILDDPEFRTWVDESFRQTAKRAGRGTQEIVRHVRLVPHVWSPETEVMTAAGKLKRHVIDRNYKETIADLFVEER